ncbi:hypothetical protein DMP17_09690 [Pseudonocardia sp. TMWB2A]|uniref:HNH endonuclease n=1 Tax=Pseudonocardia sp. TMWB2A TaxID=687430 RepID=UPI00307DA6C7
MKEKSPPTIYFNVAWMDEYRGITDSDIPLDGGSWTDKHEVCNFMPIDGKCYGYVQPPNSETINITRIGASEDADYIDSVTVVWSARARGGKTVVVGLYRNARVHRRRQKLPYSPHHQQSGFSLVDYFAECNEEDAFLLSHKRRTHFIPRGKNAMGQSLIWYGESETGAVESLKIAALLQEYITEKHQSNTDSLIMECGDTTAGSFDRDQQEIEEDVQNILTSDLSNSEKANLVRARLGQGKFRKQVMQVWRNSCAVTGCQIPAMLRASHIKPWRDCETTAERLSADNGLMLTANLDALFDRGLISFDAKGLMLISPEISDMDRERLGLQHARLTVAPSQWQERYLAYHRQVFGFSN